MPTMSSLLNRGAAWRDRRDRYGVLLAATVATFAIEGIATPGVWDQVLVTALLGCTLVLALWAADVKPRVLGVIVITAVLVFAFSVVEAVAGRVDNTAVRLANLLLVWFAPIAVVIGVVRSLKARQKVTVEAVLGVLCLYILVGLFFAQLYGAIDRLHGSFFAGNVTATPANFVYFSFTTLTTIGYGDFTAGGNLGHTLSVTEGLLGQIYLVTIVSLLVGNLGRTRGAEQ